MNFVTPSGFRDVLFDEALAREDITRAVQRLFADRGYLPIETPTLEVMDVMNAGGRGYASPFKFFDSRGDLLAMRPDVTLQIARICATRVSDTTEPLRFRYTQRVFRENDSDAFVAARETTQIGIECIGEDGVDADAEIVGLLCEALLTSCVQNFSIAIGTVSVLRSLLDRSGASEAWKAAVLNAYHASDFVTLERLCSLKCDEDDIDVSGVDTAYAEAIGRLPYIRGGREAIEEARTLVEPLGCAADLDDFEKTYDKLIDMELGKRLLVDFSVMSSFDYYTGMVFEAYSPYLGTPLGSGGRYDHMLGAYGCDLPAAGFAFYLEQAMSASTTEARVVRELEEEGILTAADADANDSDNANANDSDNDNANSNTDANDDSVNAGESTDTGDNDNNDDDNNNDDNVDICDQNVLSDYTCAEIKEARPLRIAVPKGSLNADAIACLEAAGLNVTGLADPGRQLIISNPGVDFIIVRPTDAPAFVSLGAADCGICGKDSLLEADVNAVELVDLKFGKCRFIVAEPEGATEAVEEHYRKLGSIRVATKYPNIAADYYAKTGVQVEIVKLRGNIELAPLTGMAERIVDITATGTTLRENNLCIVEEVLSSTARFFANTCAFRTDRRIVELAQALKRNADKHDFEPIAGKTDTDI